MRRGTTWPLLAALVAAAAPAAAQAGNSVPEAETAVRRLFTDLDSMRWSDAAARFHPLAVERFRTAQLDQVHAIRRMREVTYGSWDGDAPPPVVAAWLAHSDSVARAHYEPMLLRGFARITFPAQLDSLTGPEMLARWLEAHDDRVRLRSSLSRMPPAVAARLTGDSMPHVVRTVLGSVQEDDTTAHVLVRSRQAGLAGGALAGFGDLSVVTLRRATAGWRLWTSDGYSSWLGGAFGYGIENGTSAAERAAHLDAVRDSTLDWRDPATQTRVRAAIVGYPGGGRAPRGLLVEVRAPDGSLRSAEIPAASFEEIIRYVVPWITAVHESQYQQ